MFPDVSTAPRKAVAIGGFVALLAILVAVALVLREHGPGNMGNGMLVGAAVALAATAVMLVRVRLGPEHATTFERAWSQTGDERDDVVLTRALAVVGLLSLPLTALATVLVALGVDAAMALGLLLFALIGVLAAAFTLIHRRS